MKKLKVIFAGTPEFAAVALRAIAGAGHQVVKVMTQPDRPAGRGMKLQESAVKQVAKDIGCEILQPTSLRLDGKYPEEACAAKQTLETTDFDVLVVAAYGLILPQWVLDLASKDGRAGCLNIHGSLLPRWRGAAPIQRAIWSGDQKTGNCIMQMEAGLDTGPVIASNEVLITELDTTASLHDKLAQTGGELLLKVLDKYAQIGDLESHAQPSEGVTYAEKILKSEALIDWSKDASYIDRQIRALNPMPGAYTMHDQQILKIWRSVNLQKKAASNQATRPGEVVEINTNGLVVAGGDGGLIQLLEVQRAGGKRLLASQFVQQGSFIVGECLG